MLIIPLLLEMKELGWVNTYQALILPDVGRIAFAIFWMRQVIAAVPDELLDAARVDGCGEFGNVLADRACRSSGPASRGSPCSRS